MPGFKKFYCARILLTGIAGEPLTILLIVVIVYANVSLTP